MSDFPEEYTDGSVLFCGQRFNVDPRALIPRFETEELVKYCVKLLREKTEIQTIADIGTGSGIIPISIAHKTERDLNVFATDLSPDALDLARENAEKLFGKKVVSCPLDKGGQGGLEKVTHIPYNPELTEYAKDQRNTASLAENRMWYDVLRHGELKQYRFLRQKPLLNFIADFYCSELGLVIEVDGDDHDRKKDYDQYRTEELGKYGLTILRFHNLRVMEDPVGVEKDIIQWIQKNPPLVPPLSRGQGNQQIDDGITFLQGNLLEPMIQHFGKNPPESILITANLPYVREVEVDHTLIHEPRMAFVGGGRTGFVLYENFFEQLKNWKNRPRECHVVIEFGLWQRDIAETVISSYGWESKFFADLRGIERFAHICLSS